ncbi:MAG: BMP family ABC transporter substrate-binding protein [Anaerolineae bacterium]|nr:BMP family ABC transporter substrate-binding protein [Anaerolineae bacterium]
MRKSVVLLAVLAVSLLLGSVAVMAQDEIVFGVVLVGPKDDHGWSQSHYEGGLYAEQHVPGARMVVFESLNPADAPETTLLDVVTEMVGEGAKLIITTSDAFEEDTNAVATQFPDVVFINTTGSAVLNGIAPANVGNYNSQFEMGRAISGCAAALATQTGKIGYLGALINAETRRHASSAYLGARYCYEKYAGGDPAALNFTVTWIGFWFNIPGVTLDPTEETNAFFDGGADVVISGIDTTEALSVASQRSAQGESVWAMPTDNPNGCEEHPEICLGVSYYNWGPAYTNLINEVKDGTWASRWDWQSPDWTDINNLDTSPVGFTFGVALTDDQKANLESFIGDMAAFSTDEANTDGLFLWQGPLNYQDGTVLAEAGANVPPLDVWRLPQLLEGMTGASSQ